ncbi:hypothetical protein LY90DRAFT_665353 [Neocallimastix californiae]|uniref:Sequence orphan n=1 Tax=Neocallimastix californiae TaxID=1754190 RepID=A0A1Y2EZR0_9FUNG|nr:hypothetical protein LY90DRAFT_665353 [Neocallimastix californiae]|eukprot:ORY77089.1 hypothetical protein LY90DRAFT_665353 [Neocallimastix californiae]
MIKMIVYINYFIFFIILIACCYCRYVVYNITNLKIESSIINDDINEKINEIDDNILKLKVYDYGIPSNIQELYELQNGKLLPMAKVKYINYKLKDQKLDRGKNILYKRPFNFKIKSDDYIKRTINVDVYIEDFCSTMRDAACISLVGMTYSPIYVSLKENPDPNEREYAYPQALAKQLILDKEVHFTDHDIIIYLNTHMARDDYSELIVTHEIIHGLGFMGNGVLIGKSIGMVDMKEELFSPYVYFNLESSEDSYNYHLLGFLPFTIFEKYIVPIKNTSSYLFRSEFDEFYKKSVNITSYSLSAQSSARDQFTALSDIYKSIYENSKSIDKYRKIAKLYLTHNSFGFRTSDGEVIMLQSFNDKYLSSSTACHIAVPYKCENFDSCFSSEINDYDNNYLMYFSYPLQFKTSEMLKKFKNKYGLISPKLLKILTTIGWTEKGTAPESKTYYVVNGNFPDIYDNLFEIKANRKIYESSENETYLVSFSKSRYTKKDNYYFFNIFIILFIYIFL